MNAYDLVNALKMGINYFKMLLNCVGMLISPFQKTMLITIRLSQFSHPVQEHYKVTSLCHFTD